MESQLQLARMVTTYFVLWLIITILACIPRWKRLPNEKPLTILMILLFLAICMLAYWILPGAALSLNPVMTITLIISTVAQAVIIALAEKKDKWLSVGLTIAAASMSIVALVAVHLIFK